MNENDFAERRRYTRIKWLKEVTLYSGMEAYTTHILDISLKGVLLKNPEEHQPKQGGLYRLRIPLENTPAIIMNIEVVHANDESFGSEWTQIDMDSFVTLKRTIELNIKEKEDLRNDIKKLSE